MNSDVIKSSVIGQSVGSVLSNRFITQAARLEGISFAEARARLDAHSITSISVSEKKRMVQLSAKAPGGAYTMHLKLTDLAVAA